MAKAPCIELTLMCESVLQYPRELLVERITSLDEHRTWIFKDDNGRVTCRRDLDGEPAHPIACFRTKQFTCVLEPFVHGATVESPQSNNLQHWIKGVTIPRSREHDRHYIYLRSNDTVNFPDLQLNVRVMIDDDPRITGSQLASASLYNDVVDQEDDEVQVESSNVDDQQPGNDTGNDDASEESEDDEDDGDLNRASSSSQQHYTAPETIHGVTTSNEPTIKETPSHIRTVDISATNDEEEPYSTAQDRITDRDTTMRPMASDNELIVDAGSLSVLAQKARPGLSVIDSFTLNGTAPDSEEEHDMMAPPRRAEKTYSAKKPHPQRDEPDHSRPGQEEPVTIGDETTDGESDTETKTQKHLTAVVVPRPVERKRKLEEEPDSDEEDAATPEEKKPRMETSDEGSPAITQQNQGPTPRLNIRRGKLNRPTPRLSTQETGEEIAVSARKVSPQVLIGRQSRQDSPASSASSSTGKLTKILLSSDSKVNQNAPLKKWLAKMGISITDKVPSKRTNFVCVVREDHSLRSAKVLHSLAMNKKVVTDEWLIASKKDDHLLDADDFLHRTLAESSITKRDKIFAGKHLFFTQDQVANYKAGWADIKDVAKEAGAVEVDKFAFDKPHQLKADDDIFLFGAEGGDADASQLINGHGLTVYSRELFTRSILDGELKPVQKDKLAATPVAASKKKSRRS